ncbi:MAG: hypothetical protein IKK87_08250 [Bacteroidaceae bacterium]|nr:hypothetical protein [Bacteroidaceae bacterium]
MVTVQEDCHICACELCCGLGFCLTFHICAIYAAGCSGVQIIAVSDCAAIRVAHYTTTLSVSACGSDSAGAVAIVPLPQALHTATAGVLYSKTGNIYSKSGNIHSKTGNILFIGVQRFTYKLSVKASHRGVATQLQEEQILSTGY